MRRAQRKGPDNSRQLVLIRPTMRSFSRSILKSLSFFFFSFDFYRRALVSDSEDSTGPEVVFLVDGDRLKVRATLVSATSHVPVTYWRSRSRSSILPLTLSPYARRQAQTGPPCRRRDIPTMRSIAPALFSLFQEVVGVLQHRWKTRAGRDIRHTSRARMKFSLKKHFQWKGSN